MSFTKQDIYNALETITEPGEGKSLVENKHNFLSSNSKNLNWVQRLLIAIARKLTF